MNIFTYTLNLPGVFKEEHQLPCSEACACEMILDTYVVSAIAEGFKEADFGHLGAKLAVNTAVTYLKTHIDHDMKEDELLFHLRASFYRAVAAIEYTACKEEISVSRYDTTLCIALFDGKKLYYGHTKEGCLFVLYKDCGYKRVTKTPSHDLCQGHPLSLKSSPWEFGIEDHVTAAMYLTDGFLNEFFPNRPDSLLFEEGTPYISFFLNRNHVTEDYKEAFQNTLDQILRPFPLKDVTADKTIVIMIHNEEDLYPNTITDNLFLRLRRVP